MLFRSKCLPGYRFHIRREDGSTKDVNRDFFRKKSYRQHHEEEGDASVVSTCGLRFRFTSKNYHTRKADILFEDGIEKRNVDIAHALAGGVGHPILSNLCGGRAYGSFFVIRKAFRLNDGRVFYYAISSKGEHGVYTPQMMLRYSNDGGEKTT